MHWDLADSDVRRIDCLQHELCCCRRPGAVIITELGGETTEASVLTVGWQSCEGQQQVIWDSVERVGYSRNYHDCSPGR